MFLGEKIFFVLDECSLANCKCHYNAFAFPFYKRLSGMVLKLGCSLGFDYQCFGSMPLLDNW